MGPMRLSSLLLRIIGPIHSPNHNRGTAGMFQIQKWWGPCVNDPLPCRSPRAGLLQGSRSLRKTNHTKHIKHKRGHSGKAPPPQHWPSAVASLSPQYPSQALDAHLSSDQCEVTARPSKWQGYSRDGRHCWLRTQCLSPASS